jgi:TonB family protein
MRRLILHLCVAVLTFIVGTVASLLLGGILAPSQEKVSNPAVYVPKAPAPQPVSGIIPSRCGCSSSDDEAGAADDAAAATRKPISGGILNARARYLPRPAYPPIARAARASGTVAVEIVVDERGCIASARAASGHPLLQSAATQAARQACFAPTLLSGEPVKVSGVITYNFVLQ